MTDRPPLEHLDPSADVGDPRDPIGPYRPASLCPFLSSVDGDWRAASPAREHRCGAVTPPAALSPDKQRRLCLVDAHVSCTTYRAARRSLVSDETGSVTDRGAAEEAIAGAGPATTEVGEQAPPARGGGFGAPSVTRWSIPRTAPVVLDRGRPSLTALMAHRSVTQLALVLLMALAFLVLALARLSADDRRSSVPASPTPSAVASEALSPLPTVSASGTVPASVIVTPVASATTGSATPAASGTGGSKAPGSPSATTYRVVSGDTLIAIAARFHVTVKALQQANGISDPSRLRIGQVLVIP